MNNLSAAASVKTRLIDFSQQNEVTYWSDRLGIRPEVLKGAVRALKSNALPKIIAYLKSNNKITTDYMLD